MATSAARWATVFLIVALGACSSSGDSTGGGQVPDGGDDGGADGATLPPGSWQQAAVVPRPRYVGGVAAAGGKLYLVGGTPSADGFNTAPERFVVSAYDPKADAWTDLPNLPVPVILPNVAGVGDQLFVLGSLDTNQSFAYDSAGMQWVEKKPLPIIEGRGAAAVAVVDKTIYVAGGVVRGLSANMLNTGMRQTTLFAYDTTMDQWQILPGLPIAVGYAVGAIAEGQLWVMGGSTDVMRTDQILAFDLAARTWSEKNPLPRGLSSAAGGVIGGIVYLVAGIATEVGMINPNTYALDPKTETWSTLAPMETPRFETGAGIIDGRIYIPAGVTSTGPAMYGTTNSLEIFTP